MAAKAEPLKLTRLRGRLYDTLFLPENMPKDRAVMFSIPVGQYAGRKIKTFEHTNMFLPAMLPAPEEFALREVKWGVYQAGEFVDALSDLYAGAITLMASPDVVIATFGLQDRASEDCKSIIATPPRLLTDEWYRYENEHHPVVHTLKDQRAWHCWVWLINKPEVPTEFVVVLSGDHYVYPDGR